MSDFPALTAAMRSSIQEEQFSPIMISTITVVSVAVNANALLQIAKLMIFPANNTGSIHDEPCFILNLRYKC